MPKTKSRIPILLYFLLAAILLIFLILHSFSLAEIQTDFFTRFLLGMLFILLVLPLVPYVKVFDIVEVRRQTKMFKANRKK